MNIYEIDPAGYLLNGKYTKTSTPIPAVWQAASPGDYGILADGDYARVTLTKSKRAKGSEPVTFKAVNYLGPRFLRDTKVGGSDTWNLKPGVNDLVVQGVYCEIDDRSCVKTEELLLDPTHLSDEPSNNKITWMDCVFEGIGNGPEDPTWMGSGKWGVHGFQFGSWSFIRCTFSKVWDEHFLYVNTQRANIAFAACSFKWCRRTATQVANRLMNYQKFNPVGKGRLQYDDCYFEDCCVEQNGGGWYVSHHCGAPTSDLVLNRCVMRLGMNPKLAKPYNENITGSVMAIEGKESHPGAGDSAWPGGIKSVTLTDCDFERGQYFGGIGSARRIDLDIRDAEMLSLLGDNRIIEWPLADPTAIRVNRGFKWSGAPQIQGKIIYHGKPPVTWDAFAVSADGVATHV